MARFDALQAFLDAAFVTFNQFSQDLRARQSLMQIFAQLEAPQPQRLDIGKRLPVCSQHLDSVLAAETGRSSLDTLIRRFSDLEPMLEWKWRAVSRP